MIKEINFPEIITELPEVELPFEGGNAYLMQSSEKQTVFMEFGEVLHKAEIKAGYKDITIYDQPDRFEIKK